MGENGTDDVISKPRRKGRKGNGKNIFLEFGMDSDARAMTEVDIGGVIVKRFNIKRFWKSDKDLSRWQQGLHDNTRFGKLLRTELSDANPEFNADRAELMIKHNSFRRQRERVRLPCDSKNVAAQELRDLRQQLEPKETKKTTKNRDFAALFGATKRDGCCDGHTLGFGGGFSAEAPRTEDSGNTAEALNRLLDCLCTKFGSLENIFRSMDTGNKGEVPCTELTILCAEYGLRSDVAPLLRVLDKNNDSTLTLPEFLRLKPYVTRTGTPTGSFHSHRDDESLVDPARDIQVRRPKMAVKRTPGPTPPPMPSTAVLLIFRNADQSHGGQTIFVRKWPPASMASLLQVCAEACTPLFPPALVLLNGDLQLVRRVTDLVSGGAYLMKGGEALDPPTLFFSHRSTKEPSLRQLDRARSAVMAEGEDCPRPLPKETSMSSEPLGSPPWLSQHPLEPPPFGLKEQVPGSLALLLTHGGLGQPHHIHQLHTWSRALSQSRSVDHIAASTSF